MSSREDASGKMHDVASREGRTVLLGQPQSRGNQSDGGPRFAPRFWQCCDRRLGDGCCFDVPFQRGNCTDLCSSPEKACRAPHVRRIEVSTSDANGVHRFGKPLEVKFWIRHDEPISKACFSFNIVNYNLQNIVHAWALYPEHSFGPDIGKSMLTCRFPALRLNVGRFHLRTYLTGPPGGEVYERLEGICAFEVVRTDNSVMWGWHPENCAYHEQWSWNLEPVEPKAASSLPMEFCLEVGPRRVSRSVIIRRRLRVH